MSSSPRVLRPSLKLAVTCLTILSVLHTYFDNLESHKLPYTTNNAKVDLTIPLPKPTLVHIDPHFSGGFRNQHMRFVAFVNYAVKNNISQILLPSLRWGDAHNQGKSMLHEHLFDVQFWNKRANAKGLPRLVKYDSSVLEGVDASSLGFNIPPCWNVTSGLYNELDEGLLRGPGTNLHKIDTSAMIGSSDYGGIFSHCKGRLPGVSSDDANGKSNTAAYSSNSNTTTRQYTHLIPHGGGNAAGKLWWEYMQLQNERQKTSATVRIGNNTVTVYPEHAAVEKAMYQLLQPSDTIRLAMENAIHSSMRQALHETSHLANSSTIHKGTNHGDPSLLALHPRIEKDMLIHRCSRFMERNLTTVFQRLETYPAFLRRDGEYIDSMRRRRLEGRLSWNSTTLEHSMQHISKNTNNTVASPHSNKNHARRSHSNHTKNNKFVFDTVFVAVSRTQVGSIHPDLAELMTGNLVALNNAVEYGLFGTKDKRGVPMFESGENTAEKVRFPTLSSSSSLALETTISAESQGAVELVASIINFFTAVRADAFVGVRGSSYSTDVFSARYYLHQESSTEEGENDNNIIGGEQNHVLGPEGIEQLIGPPPPHSCSAKK